MKAPSNEFFVKSILAIAAAFSVLVWARSSKITFAEEPAANFSAKLASGENKNLDKLPFPSDLENFQCSNNEETKQCSSVCSSSQDEDKLREEIKKQEEKEKKERAAKYAATVENSKEKKYVGNPSGISSGAIISDGKTSCHLKNNHPGKSKTKGIHVDEDCCIDYDEYLAPGCVYSPADVQIAKKRK